ncbi:DinB family protein [Segetibacter koreensis]|uniref:DinB family protein n=1 Tax=Segetibacter koreensis TaxID=398037 RepID=UPI000376F9FB|nr:DinB family protein [Segetibacter koreensis]
MTSETVLIKMVLDAWNTHLKRTDELFNSLSDEQLMKEIAPGRNRGIYLLGHLAAVHDRILPLLELGSSLHPELWQPFVERPDKEVTELPTTQMLRQCWKEINTNLANKISALSPETWFQKHTSVSEEDFAKERHRNKLNIIVNRTNHLANHLGQLLLLKSKDE